LFLGLLGLLGSYHGDDDDDYYYYYYYCYYYYYRFCFFLNHVCLFIGISLAGVILSKLFPDSWRDAGEIQAADA